MKHELLSHLLSEVMFHTHSRLERLLPSEEAKLEAETHDSFTSIEALVFTAIYCSNNPNILVCDTDHPVHVLDRKGIQRKGSFSSDKLHETVNILDLGIQERAKILKSTSIASNILSGVEADILSESGRLDISDETLAKLDITIASLHPRYWKSFSGTEITSRSWVNALVNVASNPHIDVLGHPTRDYMKSVTETADLKDWLLLADKLQETGVAYEINYLNLRPEKLDFAFQCDVIKMMAKKEVSFIFGFDFHEFSDYGSTIPKGTYINSENVSELISVYSAQQNLFRNSTSQNIVSLLYQLGVNEENCVNSSRNHLLNWLNS